MSRNRYSSVAMRRRGAAVIVAVVAFLLVAAPAIGVPRDNPFVGSWESFDDFIDPGDGFHDTSHVRLQIGNSGQWNLRDDGANVCRVNGFGFVPGTIKGSGEFVSNGGPEFHTSGDLYCYPRDGRGRTLLLEGLPGNFVYDEVSDTLDDGFSCWWRTGRGDPSDCDT